MAMLVAAGAIAYAVVNGHIWVAIPIFLAAIGIVMLLQRWSMKSSLALVRRDLRRQEIEPEVHTTAIPVEIRRTANKGLPATLTAIFGAALGAALVFADRGFVVLIAIFAIPTLGVAWGMAWRRSGQFVARLDFTSLVLPRAKIPWANVARIDFGYESRAEIPYLTIRVIEPLPSRGWMDRLNSSLSRGAADREIIVRLHHVREDPELLHEIAEQLWRGAAGDTLIDVARVAQLHEAVAATRRFRDLPKSERWYQIGIFLWVVVILALAAYGAAANFQASDVWSRTSGWIAAGLTGLGLWLLLRGPGLASLRRGGGSVSYLAMFAVVFALLAVLCWSIVGRSLPDLATLAFGEPREMTWTLTKDSRTSSRKCRKLIGASISNSGSFRYCASAAEYAALPASGPMRLFTRVSWFGVHVDRIEPIDPSWTR